MCRSAFEMALRHLRMGESAEMKVGFCVAACCSVLPCVAVCGSVLQCVGGWDSQQK